MDFHCNILFSILASVINPQHACPGGLVSVFYIVNMSPLEHSHLENAVIIKLDKGQKGFLSIELRHFLYLPYIQPFSHC